MPEPGAEHCEVFEPHKDKVLAVSGSMPSEDELYDLAELFKVFGDSTRMRILFALFGDDICVCDIAEALGMTQSAISHQLRILKNARLVKSRRDGKTVIYSGDVRSTDDLAPFLEQGCDLLLMETGHHSAPELCRQWQERNYAIGRVLFMHHGREMLRDQGDVARRCEAIRGKTVSIAFDGMELEL